MRERENKSMFLLVSPSHSKCVCVCVREREQNTFYQPLSLTLLMCVCVCVFVCVCVLYFRDNTGRVYFFFPNLDKFIKSWRMRLVQAKIRTNIILNQTSSYHKNIIYVTSFLVFHTTATVIICEKFCVLHYLLIIITSK